MSQEPAPQAARSRELHHAAPLHAAQLFGHLAATAVPGVEEWRDGTLRRALRLAHGPAVVSLRPPATATGVVRLVLESGDLRDLEEAAGHASRVLDLLADPVAVDVALSQDPALATLVRAAPGRRVPRSWEAGEMAVRAVLGQQVSTAAARTHAGRLAARFGTPVTDPGGGLTHLFPTTEQLLTTAPADLALPHARRRTLLGLVAALHDGLLTCGGPSEGVDAVVGRLLALPGIGPWTASTIALRALGDDDAFLPGDLGALAAARSLGLADGARSLERRSRRWSPWRGYALQHLWGVLPHALNTLPA